MLFVSTLSSPHAPSTETYPPAAPPPPYTHSPPDTSNPSPASQDYTTHTQSFRAAFPSSPEQASSQPFLGGSTTTTSAFIPFAYISGITFSTSPATNSTFSTPLSSAFLRAPEQHPQPLQHHTPFLAFCDRKSDMVPMPQYRSKTVSLPVRPAYSRAFPYSTSVCTGLT